jgi:L-lysine exporter family protein LysE/ArgO
MPFTKGVLLGLGLIIAIGAQNAFVLKQGLARSQVFIVCVICAVCDAILIACGTLGAGTFFAGNKLLSLLLGVLGIGFLIFYAIRNLFSAFKSDQAIEQSTSPQFNRVQIIKLTLGFTLLNPHVYLDTVVLFGSFSARFDNTADRLQFALGGMAVSLVWFFGLGYGAAALSPVFASKRMWRNLEFGIGTLMLFLSYKLGVSVLDLYRS